MAISIHDLDISRAPFSRRGSRIMVLEGPSVAGVEASQSSLFIAYTSGVNSQKGSRYNLIRIDPVYDGLPVPYTYKANPGKLTLRTEYGSVDICFESDDVLRIRGSGVGIQFFLPFRYHEQFLDRLDGTVVAGFNEIGEFLFEAISGSQSHNGAWNAPKMIPEDTTVIWAPDKDGNLSGYLRHADWSPDRLTVMRPFDECVADALRDFDEWCRKYEPVPEKYAHIRLYAIYLIWICCLSPKGKTPVDMVYMMRNGMLMRAMGWHQGYQAMAAWQDIDLAVRWLYSMFHIRDEYGQLPDGANSSYRFMLTTKPPFQGFALLNILDHVGIDALTVEHCTLLYEPMIDWINWWLNFHDCGDGFVSYLHADESGWDDSTIFHKGLPVESADIAAFLVLLMEAVGKIGERLGKAEESVIWLKRSADLLDLMIKTFWNGEKFIGRLSRTHEVVDCDSIAICQPIILGKRLPDDIIDKIAEMLGDPKKFFTSRGFVSESLASEYYDVNGPFMMGMIIAPVQLMITVGLYNAGKKELALESARRWCELSLESGVVTVTRDVDNEKSRVVPKVFAEGEEPVFPQGRTPGGESSWGAAVFLVLGAMLMKEGN